MKSDISARGHEPSQSHFTACGLAAGGAAAQHPKTRENPTASRFLGVRAMEKASRETHCDCSKVHTQGSVSAMSRGGFCESFEDWRGRRRKRTTKCMVRRGCCDSFEDWRGRRRKRTTKCMVRRGFCGDYGCFSIRCRGYYEKSPKMMKILQKLIAFV